MIPFLTSLKQSWHSFKEGEPGCRFQDRYWYRRQRRKGRFDPARIARVAGGIVIMLGGLFTVPAPGPGWLIVFFGIGLLSSEFLAVARVMDAGEVKGRAGFRRARALWARTARPLRILLVLLLLAGVLAAGYGFYHVIM